VERPGLFQELNVLRRARRIVKDCGGGLGTRPSLEGMAPGDSLEKHDAQTEQIAPAIRHLAEKLLGRHVGGSANHRSRHRQPAIA